MRERSVDGEYGGNSDDLMCIYWSRRRLRTVIRLVDVGEITGPPFYDVLICFVSVIVGKWYVPNFPKHKCVRIFDVVPLNRFSG